MYINVIKVTIEIGHELSMNNTLKGLIHMNILDRYSNRINGTFTFFDRIMIKGYLTRFFTTGGAGSYASQCGIMLKDFSTYAKQVTEELKQKIKEYTESQGREMKYLYSSSTCKEDIALQCLKDNPVDEGLICTIYTLEECWSLEPKKNNETGLLELRRVKKKCLHYYFYMIDKVFGFMFVKLQSWFPFEVTIYINGREMMKPIFRKNNIDFTMYDNSFSTISDIQKAQKLADKQADNAKRFSKKFDKLADTLNPYLKTFRKINGEGYRWYLWQCEIATDIMFKSRKDLEDIYPSVVNHAFHDFSCTDVFSFMGRKLTKQFKGETVADYKKRPVGWRVKFKLNSNHIKFYDKANCLRIETTINRPKEFKVYKSVHHKNGETGKQWVPMGKALSNMYRYAEIGKECNKRMIQAMNDIVPTKSVITNIESACAKKNVDGKTVTGMNVWDRDIYHVLQVISDGKFIIKGFQNSDIRDLIYPKKLEESKKKSRTTRLLQKLRNHNLIKKIPHSFRYQLTAKGRQVCSGLIYMKEYMYPQAVDIAMSK